MSQTAFLRTPRASDAALVARIARQRRHLHYIIHYDGRGLKRQQPADVSPITIRKEKDTEPHFSW
jgi:hypothetical protein